MMTGPFGPMGQDTWLLGKMVYEWMDGWMDNYNLLKTNITKHILLNLNVFLVDPLHF